MFRLKDKPQRPTCNGCGREITMETWSLLGEDYCSLLCIPTYLRRICIERPEWKWMRP